MSTPEKLRQAVQIEAAGIEWMAIVADIFLALRHPDNTGPAAELSYTAARRILDTLQAEGIITQDEARKLTGEQ